jgi:hypothetical protein
MATEDICRQFHARQSIGGIAVMAAAFSGSPNLTFGLLLLFLVLNVFFMMFLAARKQAQLSIPLLRPTDEGQVRQSVDAVMDVTNEGIFNGVSTFQGTLKEPSKDAFGQLRKQLENIGVPILQGSPEKARLTIVPGKLADYIPSYRVYPLVHIALAVLTLVSTTWVGSKHAGHSGIDDFASLLAGLSYSLPLMAILGIHETGHYVFGRLHGMAVSPPFFVPVPFGLGTFGAFIQLRSPAEGRKALFDMAVAGPLCGLVAAIIALFVGLQTSVIVHPATPQIYSDAKLWEEAAVSGSMLLTVVAELARGDAIRFGDLIRFSPLASAGWIGFWITAINLLPVGQLDGGHIFQSMFGSTACEGLTRAILLLLLSFTLFVSPAFLMWLIVFYIVSGPIVPPLNDMTKLSRARMLLAIFSLSLVGWILLPDPHIFTLDPQDLLRPTNHP